MSVFNYLVSRAKNITLAGNPAERNKVANVGELGGGETHASDTGDLSSNFPLHTLHWRSS